MKFNIKKAIGLKILILLLLWGWPILFFPALSVSADSVFIENSVKSSSNTGNNSTEETGFSIKTGKADSKSSSQIDINSSSDAEVKIKTESKANEEEARLEVNEKMQNLPSAFQKKQTHETEGTKAKAEITVQKESGTDSAAPERERFKKQPEESANLFSFLNILGKSFSSLANSITSKISLFFS